MKKLPLLLLFYGGFSIGWIIAFGKEEFEYEYLSRDGNIIRMTGIFSLLHNVSNILIIILFLYWDIAQHQNFQYILPQILSIPFNLANITFVSQCAHNPIGGLGACYHIKTPLTILTLINYHIYGIIIICCIVNIFYIKCRSIIHQPPLPQTASPLPRTAPPLNEILIIHK